MGRGVVASKTITFRMPSVLFFAKAMVASPQIFSKRSRGKARVGDCPGHLHFGENRTSVLCADIERKRSLDAPSKPRAPLDTRRKLKMEGSVNADPFASMSDEPRSSGMDRYRGRTGIQIGPLLFARFRLTEARHTKVSTALARPDT